MCPWMCEGIAKIFYITFGFSFLFQFSVDVNDVFTKQFMAFLADLCVEQLLDLLTHFSSLQIHDFYSDHRVRRYSYRHEDLDMYDVRDVSESDVQDILDTDVEVTACG